ncbi:MAG: hypothetical protein ACXVJ3_20890, partial [Ilumatobacteraceae bacterium]
MLCEVVASARTPPADSAIVVQGEMGVGKSALMESAAAASGATQVVRVAGVLTEIDLEFGALQRLLQGMLGQFG